MASLNRVFLIGNLTRDPEVRYIPSGTAVADLHMAINRRYKTKTGEDRDDPCFIGVVVWDKQAETAGKYLKKGSPVFVEGSLRYEQWETNGEKRNRIRVHADRIQFLDRRKIEDPGDVPEQAGADRAESAGARTAGPAREPPAGDAKADAPEDDKADADDLPF